jgi:hypothetical protein
MNFDAGGRFRLHAVFSVRAIDAANTAPFQRTETRDGSQAFAESDLQARRLQDRWDEQL